jgi:DHA1 family bicyclomycin/chloramphenicol resistance-like MFS transporter
MLIAARFVQALGACAGPVLGRAVVRDVWGATESARIIAYMGGAMAIAPLLGPTLGGFLTVLFGWQSNFVVLLLICIAQTIAVARLLAKATSIDTRERRIRASSSPTSACCSPTASYLGYVLTFPFPTARCSPSSRLRPSCSANGTG